VSSSNPQSSSRRLVIATVLVIPATVFVGANVVQYGRGIGGAGEWLDPLYRHASHGVDRDRAHPSRPVAALLLAASRIIPIRFDRDDDVWEVRIRCVLTAGRSSLRRSACWWAAFSRVT
jgi:hypothetical protein